MMEEWKDVVGYEGLYEVSNLGRIRNNNGVVLRPQKSNHGYKAVWLYGKEKSCGKNGKSYLIHRIVAEAFIENPNGFKEVNHKNEVKWDNRADNLEWCTHQYNSAYGTRGERIGAKNLNGKKSTPIDQLDRYGNYIKTFASWADARRAGFSPRNIYKQMHGEYTHAYGYKWRYASQEQ